MEKQSPILKPLKPLLALGMVIGLSGCVTAIGPAISVASLMANMVIESSSTGSKGSKSRSLDSCVSDLLAEADAAQIKKEENQWLASNSQGLALYGIAPQVKSKAPASSMTIDAMLAQARGETKAPAGNTKQLTQTKAQPVTVSDMLAQAREKALALQETAKVKTEIQVQDSFELSLPAKADSAEFSASPVFLGQQKGRNLNGDSKKPSQQDTPSNTPDIIWHSARFPTANIAANPATKGTQNQTFLSAPTLRSITVEEMLAKARQTLAQPDASQAGKTLERPPAPPLLKQTASQDQSPLLSHLTFLSSDLESAPLQQAHPVQKRGGDA